MNVTLTNDLTCRHTIVKNTSGVRRYFGFLPDKGVWLDADEEYSVLGELEAAIVRSGRSVDQPRLKALKRALAGYTNAEGDLVEPTLTIVQTPAPVLQDLTTGVSQVLSLDNGTLGVLDECWSSSA